MYICGLLIYLCICGLLIYLYTWIIDASIYIYTYINTYMCVSVCMYVCVCVCVRIINESIYGYYYVRIRIIDAYMNVWRMQIIDESIFLCRLSMYLCAYADYRFTIVYLWITDVSSYICKYWCIYEYKLIIDISMNKNGLLISLEVHIDYWWMHVYMRIIDTSLYICGTLMYHCMNADYWCIFVHIQIVDVCMQACTWSIIVSMDVCWLLKYEDH